MDTLDLERRITLSRRSCRYAEAERLIGDLPAPAAEVELGHIAIDRGRDAAAMTHFERALELDPDFEPALAWRVAALSRLHRYRDAFVAAETALRQNPERHLVRVALAHLWEDEHEDYERELAELDQVLAADPAHLQALEWRIYTLADLNRFDEAEQQTLAAQLIHAEAAELWVASGYVSLCQAKYREAAERCDHALRIHPEYVYAFGQQVKFLRLGSLHDEALAKAEQAAEQVPWAGALYFAWGMALGDIDDDLGALRKFEQAVEREPDDEDGHDWRATALRWLGRFDQAMEALREARARLPGSARLAVEQAWLHDTLGESEAALNAVREALRLDPASSAAHGCHIRLLRDAYRYDEAEQATLTAIESQPGVAALANALGWVYADQDRDEEALRWFRRALELSPIYIAGICDTARALQWLHRLDEAETLLRESEKLVPEASQVTEQLGLVLENLGRYDEAHDAYRRIVDRHPRSDSSWNNIIDLLRKQHRFSEAEQAARTAIDLNPHSVNLRLSLVRVLDAQQRREDLTAELRRAWQELPNNYTLPRQLAIHLADQGKTDEALEVLARIPDDSITKWWRVRLLDDARRYDEAIEAATAYRDQDPEDANSHRALGLVQQSVGDDEAALVAFEQALEVDPTDTLALRNRIDSLRSLRRYTEAEQLLLTAIAQRPQLVALAQELAVTYWQMGRRDDSLAEYERGLKIAPRNRNLLYGRVNVLRRTGRLDEAEVALTEALELYPHSLVLLAQMGKLRDDQNRYDEALEWFDKAYVAVPNGTWVLAEKSATLRSLGRFAEAERILEPAVRRKPADTSLLMEFGWVLRDRGELSRATKTFNELRELAGNQRDRAEALHCLGWVSFTDGDFDEARRLFTEALGQYPHSIDAKLGLAWTLVRQAEPEGETAALKLCHEVLAEDARRHMAHTCLGVLYSHQGDLPQAEYHLRHSIEIDPFHGSYVDLGALFVQMGRLPEAEELLEKAIERNWYDSQAHIELGGVYLQSDSEDPHKDARRAAQCFRHALTVDRTSGAGAMGLGLALRAGGDLVAAERVLREALNRPDCDQPRWRLLVVLARVLIERGDAAGRRDLHLEALSAAQEAIELATDQADPYYLAGIAAYQAGESGPEAQARPFYRRRAVRYLRACLRHDPVHTEARRVMTLAEQSLAVTRGSLVGSMAMVFISGALLIVLWLGFFLTDKVNTVMIGTLTPVLAGLVALGFVLPFLVKLRLPGGVEADLSASLSQLSSGPTGELSLGPGRLVGHGFEGSQTWAPLATGPRGELPRLG